MPSPRRIAVIASVLTAACLAAGGSVVLVTAHIASAENSTVSGRPRAAADHGDTRIPGTGVVTQGDPAAGEVLTGALGSGDRSGATTFAYAGDSITARTDSWLHVLEPDTRFHALGGYAHSGYRADQVLHEVRPVPGAAVLVVEVGTNDVTQAIPTATTIANVDAIVRRVGAPHTLVVAGPPSDWTTSPWGADRRTGQLALSRALGQDATAHGWSYVDPFVEFRQPDGSWVRGASPDGIHGSAATNVLVARAMAEAIAKASH
ncbi:SGNH/GDSL hydrolase family protein [Curtobacterium sp. ISL-83]|uniref:SGNH/GDSL hydrolase family protein n=1 Tax=Curtobacterium sp. ISL-83 TaxID=2819145 RepID=UPI001BE71C17|nr:SGNH/GDSL hydrolase family protein [Curtobacterium sp. ISL-83]MBT2502096.1 SGNH/GDSL hydrolase family protein [Curtobacterium sp. ISL-83]